jgi:hypothetical protein
MIENDMNSSPASMNTPTQRSGELHQQAIRQRIPGAAPTVMGTEKTGFQPSARFVMTLLKYSFSLCALSALIYLSAVYFGKDISRAGHSASTEVREIVLANSVMKISDNFIRMASQRKNGQHQQIDLYAEWPSMTGYSDERRLVFSNADNASHLIFLKIEPRSMSFDMSGRLQPIYSIFFEGLGIEEANGLIRQPLSESGGYVDEDMYFDGSSPYPFAARCIRETSSVGAPICIRDIHINKDLMVTYRFHKSFLNDWRSLEKSVRGFVKSKIVNKDIAMAN